jgi:hypothetical protein
MHEDIDAQRIVHDPGPTRSTACSHALGRP